MHMKGKAKCKALKEIRHQIAIQNDIPYVVSQCTYQGDCKGTCPKCEAELKYLERELAIRQGLGKVIAITGISMTLCSSLSACSHISDLPNSTETQIHNNLPEEVEGAFPAPEEPQETAVGIAGDIALPETQEP